jgi:hypothetical protein
MMGRHSPSVLTCAKRGINAAAHLNWQIGVLNSMRNLFEAQRTGWIAPTAWRNRGQTIHPGSAESPRSRHVSGPRPRLNWFILSEIHRSFIRAKVSFTALTIRNIDSSRFAMP